MGQKGQGMSVQQIIRELPPEFVRKMRNWVRSELDGGMYAASKMFEDVIASSDGYDSHMPILQGEAWDVNICLQTLAPKYREAVRDFWKWEGNSIRWLGRRLHVEHHTARARLDEGHRQLQAALHKLADRCRRYNEHAASTTPQPRTAAGFVSL